MFVKPENNCDQITHVVEHIAINWSKTEINTNAAILISWPLFRMHVCKAATTSWPIWKYTFFAMECYFQYIRNVDVARVSMLPPTNFVCITQVWAIENDIQKGKQASSRLCQGQDAQKYAYELLEATKGPGRRRHNQKLISRQFPSFHIKTEERQNSRRYYRINHFEAFGPVQQSPWIECSLLHRKWEGETYLPWLTSNRSKSITFPCHKAREFLCNKIKQLLAASNHEFRWNCNLLILLLNHPPLFPTQLNSQHPEVGPTQVHSIVKTFLISAQTPQIAVLYYYSKFSRHKSG